MSRAVVKRINLRLSELRVELSKLALDDRDGRRVNMSIQIELYHMLGMKSEEKS